MNTVLESSVFSAQSATAETPSDGRLPAVTRRRLRLLLSCADVPTIPSAVNAFLDSHGVRIVQASHFADGTADRLYIRKEFDVGDLDVPVHQFRHQFMALANRFGMEWRLGDSHIRKRVVVLVSQYDHCLVDLLTRCRNQECDFEIACVISNHDLLRGIVEWHGIPYHHIPVVREHKAAAFARVGRLFEQYQGDVMVLARYMQILPGDFCTAYANRIINIHHSFLPAFAGARPYHRAYERGVKMIGATCHYVTADLDEGPIIDQDAVRVDHADTVEDFIRSGRDVERRVLALGLQAHVEDRVAVVGNKTIVF